MPFTFFGVWDNKEPQFGVKVGKFVWLEGHAESYVTRVSSSKQKNHSPLVAGKMKQQVCCKQFQQQLRWQTTHKLKDLVFPLYAACDTFQTVDERVLKFAIASELNCKYKLNRWSQIAISAFNTIKREIYQCPIIVSY